MKPSRCLRYAFRYATGLIGCIFVLMATSCNLDPAGWFWSSDVDTRFNESLALPPPAPPPVTGGSDGSFSFVVITDIHVFEGASPNNPFPDLRADIAAAGDSFVLACGDLVQNGHLADYGTYRTLTQSLGVPVYSVPGNHDVYNQGWDGFRDVLGPDHYSFSAGTGDCSLRVIAIDSANGTLGAPQRQWLEEQLANRSERWCASFTHFQFFCDLITESQQWTDPVEAWSLMNLFETQGVNMHFSGHSHRLYQRTINGTLYCTAPALREGYVRVQVSPTGMSLTPVWF